MDSNKKMHKFFKSLVLSGKLIKAISILCSISSHVPPPIYSLLLQETIQLQQFNLGKKIHSHILSTGFIPGNYLNTKLLIFYSKAGDFKAAHHLFDEIPEPNIFAYNSMISGLARNRSNLRALDLFDSMRASGLDPDQFTFSSVFYACAGLGDLDHGRRVHCVMMKMKIVSNVIVNTAIVDMYLKCSSLVDARKVFDEFPERNLVTWSSLISGYGRHGRVEDVFKLFDQMLEEGLRPNSVTFLSILSACSHGGFVDLGWKYFASMIEDYGVRPRKEHYAVMVDMMGRSGRLNEAYEFVRNSPSKDHSEGWGALIGACRIHGDVGMVEVAARQFFELKSENVFADCGMWEKVDDVWERILRLGMKKETAWSSLGSGNCFR